MRIEKNAVDLVYELMETGREYTRACDRLHDLAPVNFCRDIVETRKAEAYADYEKHSERVSVYCDVFRVDPVAMWEKFGDVYDELTDGVTEDLARRWLKECKI